VEVERSSLVLKCSSFDSLPVLDDFLRDVVYLQTVTHKRYKGERGRLMRVTDGGGKGDGCIIDSCPAPRVLPYSESP